MGSVVPSIKITKSFEFKGGIREWANRYHFDGTLPPDSTHWTTLANAIILAEKACHAPYVSIVAAEGYAAGSDVPVFSATYSTAGTGGGAGGETACPGEAAALIRWSTAARSTKNHPIYCFSYYHGVYHATTSAAVYDTLSTTMKAAYATYATDWVSGFSDGAVTHHRATPAGHVATGSIVEEFITHRDFPYTTSV